MVKFYCKHFGRCSSIKDSVDAELLQLWFTHFILVKAYVGSSPTRATKCSYLNNWLVGRTLYAKVPVQVRLGIR